ncbi:hypothetical protein [Dactylosporangium sp. NPDC006015]|uniref:hypothetical protein n=1 Tax=Dactylosporangium sp. NPDC006015 TaxID=3154576 RepID=UPI00339FF412
MARRGRSTTIGKFAKLYQDRRVSEIRMLGELLRHEQSVATGRTSGLDARADRVDAAHPND